MNIAKDNKIYTIYARTFLFVFGYNTKKAILRGGDGVKIGFVSENTLSAFAEREAESAELILFGFNGVGEVNYEKELKGESVFFQSVALLSKKQKNVLACGCITNTRGHKRKSVVVAENGRLLGVSDMLHSIDGEWGCGANLRVYETKIGKMGVLVAEDLYFPEAVRSLVLCGSDFIFCVSDECENALKTSYIRTYAHAYGTPILLCGMGFCAIAEPVGELAFSSPASPVFACFDGKKEYHLVETRRSGVYKA